ncbi:MAG: tyrosine-type recombinase/integrase [Deltaproteobacteria bacterium]|nr:tyrosine-type recombinase/integrase [Deltaproteobacteria bacterium]
MDTKAGDNRTIHTTTQRVMKMLDRRKHESDSPYVFPARDGGKQKQVNVVFLRTVRDLGLNDGIDDDRKKVCFHTMRHTFASRLAMAGVPLYTIKTAMGHHSIIMTERYAHLMPDTLREAMAVLEKKPDNVIELKQSAKKA